MKQIAYLLYIHYPYPIKINDIHDKHKKDRGAELKLISKHDIHQIMEYLCKKYPGIDFKNNELNGNLIHDLNGGSDCNDKNYYELALFNVDHFIRSEKRGLQYSLVVEKLTYFMKKYHPNGIWKDSFNYLMEEILQLKKSHFTELKEQIRNLFHEFKDTADGQSYYNIKGSSKATTPGFHCYYKV